MSLDQYLIAVVPNAFSFPFAQLPREILEIIFKNFTPADYWTMACTCRRLRAICRDEKVWRAFSENIYVLAYKYWTAREQLTKLDESHYTNLLAVLESIANKPEKYHVSTNLEACKLSLAIAQDATMIKLAGVAPFIRPVAQRCLGSVLGQTKDIQKISSLQRGLSPSADVETQLSMLQVIQHLVGSHLCYCSPYDVSIIQCVEMVYAQHEARVAEAKKKAQAEGESEEKRTSAIVQLFSASDDERVVRELESLMRCWEDQTAYGSKVGSMKLRQLLSKRMPADFVAKKTTRSCVVVTPAKQAASSLAWYNPLSWWNK